MSEVKKNAETVAQVAGRYGHSLRVAFGKGKVKGKSKANAKGGAKKQGQGNGAGESDAIAVSLPPAPPVPQKGWSLAKHKKSIKSALPTLRAYERRHTEFVTRIYWVVGKSKSILETKAETPGQNGKLPGGKTVAQFLESLGIDKTMRCRAAKICAHYKSPEQAAKVSMGDALAAIRGDGGKGGRKPLAGAALVKRKLDSMQSIFAEIRDESEKLTADELEAMGDLIVQLASELQELASRVPQLAAE